MQRTVTALALALAGCASSPAATPHTGVCDALFHSNLQGMDLARIITMCGEPESRSFSSDGVLTVFYTDSSLAPMAPGRRDRVTLKCDRQLKVVSWTFDILWWDTVGE